LTFRSIFPYSSWGVLYFSRICEDVGSINIFKIWQISWINWIWRSTIEVYILISFQIIHQGVLCLGSIALGNLREWKQAKLSQDGFKGAQPSCLRGWDEFGLKQVWAHQKPTYESLTFHKYHMIIKLRVFHFQETMNEQSAQFNIL